MKMLNKTGPSTDPWGTSLVTSLQPDCAADHNPLSSASQTVLNPHHCPLIYPTLSQLHYKDTVGNSVKHLAEGKALYIHCYPSIDSAGDGIIEGYTVGNH